MKFSGMAPGKYATSSGSEVVLADNGRLSLASDPNVLAGSSSTMLQCMNHLASLGVFSENEMWQVGFTNPLRILGLPPEHFSRQRQQVKYDAQEQQFRVV